MNDWEKILIVEYIKANGFTEEVDRYRLLGNLLDWDRERIDNAHAVAAERGMIERAP